MVLSRAQHRKQLQNGLNTIFGMEYKRWREEWRDIFDVENSGKSYEEDVLMMGFAGAQTKAEGAGVAYDEGGEGWVARYHHITVALAFALTQEAEEDGLYGSLGRKYSKALATSMQYTKEVNGANILNRGFNSAYAGGDGVELFSTAHPLRGGGTFANELVTPADLSESSLEDALIAISKFKDERGIPVQAKAKKLIIPTELMFTASRILKSHYRTSTADNDVNVINKEGFFPEGHCVNHYLTDTDAWFIKTDVTDGLKHFVRKGIQRGMEGDFESGNMRYKARERYSFGWTNPRGAFASAGS